MDNMLAFCFGTHTIEYIVRSVMLRKSRHSCRYVKMIPSIYDPQVKDK